MFTHDMAEKLWSTAWNECVDFDQSSFAHSVAFFRKVGPPSSISDLDFYGEYCWAVLMSGLSEATGRSVQQKLRDAGLLEQPLKTIVKKQNHIRSNALKVFHNGGKVAAMIEMAEYLFRNPGIGPLLARMDSDEALSFLDNFPFIGPATSRFLARNIGFDFVKPDRHLVRLSEIYSLSPDQLCQIISAVTSERVGVVDYVLWQWCSWLGFDHVQEVAPSIALANGLPERTTITPV